ncbi:ribonuclease E inhibitor RraA/Dimethylmenaquinone methyltransferase [Bisporella sp. PMI_857]|nr:ribonuclease E inhibitor RraA/Dimethylmenaquinone methyltransferase [Bisporella sp. PMI_857]
MASKASKEALKSLSKFASCDVGDALVKLGVKYGGYLAGISMWSPTRQSGNSKIFGPAYTVQMVAANDTASPKSSLHFADGIPKDSVVFVSQPKGLYSACWGGLMSTRAKHLGAQGVIIDGNFRDVNEHRDLGFPLFARGSSILGSASFTRSSTLNEPVQFTSETQKEPLTVHPGDLILGDADGVVVVPPTLVEQCLRYCEERWDIDEKTRKCLENGDEMGSTISKLRK